MNHGRWRKSESRQKLNNPPCEGGSLIWPGPGTVCVGAQTLPEPSAPVNGERHFSERGACVWRLVLTCAA